VIDLPLDGVRWALQSRCHALNSFRPASIKTISAREQHTIIATAKPLPQPRRGHRIVLMQIVGQRLRRRLQR
jgi:hypothetical protein